MQAISGSNSIKLKRVFPRFKQPGLITVTGIIAAVMSLPLFYVIARALQGNGSQWKTLLDGRIPSLLLNTFLLTSVVTSGAVILGVTLAWIVIRTDLPGRSYWRWILAIPVTISSYVCALVYIVIFGTGGVWNGLFPSLRIDLYSFGGLAFVLILSTYPYVFLFASSALRRLNLNFEEAALASGMSYFKVFLKIVLPLLRPAIGGAAVLVALYVLSEFGSVSLLRYNTFTSAIYYQYASFDRNASAILSCVLIILASGVLFLEYRTRARKKFYQTTGTFRTGKIVNLHKWKYPALLFTILVTTFSLVLPFLVLSYWSIKGLFIGAINSKFFAYSMNSFLAAGAASLLCMFISLPFIYLNSRYPTTFSRFFHRIAYSGYALPGVIIALGVIFVVNSYVPLLYASAFLIVFAYVIRFLPQTIQAGGSSMALISPRLDEAARSLGYGSWKILFKVITPLAYPGILVGGALVFVSSLKELPATLMLRPAGFDTLAVRIYLEASEGFYVYAAPAALFLIVISLLPLKWMLQQYENK